MTAARITPYRSAQQPGRDDFAHLLWSEWTKFRTVRGWVIAVIAAAALAALAVVALAAAAAGAKGPNTNPAVASAGSPTIAIGPGGEAVTDDFYFVHQAQAGNASLTARVTSLTSSMLPGEGPPGAGPQPWAKAGIIIKASTRPGSAYAAVMATPGHGVRLQWNYTGDTAGLPGAVSAGSPRWLRLTRSGDTITGYDSADGRHWATLGTVTLAGLPPTVQAGLFVAAPYYLAAAENAASNTVAQLPTHTTAVFDSLSLTDGQPGTAWTASSVGRPIGQDAKFFGGKTELADNLVRSGSAFTVTGYGGDIAPYVTPEDPLGLALKGTVIGLIAITALGALFITAEYRRGLIRLTLTASPRRGRVLAAKAVVIGAVTFVAGLIGAAVAIAAVVGLVIVPLILAVVLPQGPGLWVLRLTPAAAFGVQRGIPQYPQVMNVCEPHNGCFPLAPWTGFAVGCAWAAAALGLAVCLLRRRDA